MRALQLRVREYEPEPRGRTSLVISIVALLVAISGTAWAASISGSQIINGSVTGRDVKDQSLTGVDVANDSIRSADLGTGSVGSNEIVTGAVESAEIAAGAVGSADIADGSIAAIDLAATTVVQPGGTVPTGTTITGAWADSMADTTAGGAVWSGNAISFPWVMPQRLTPRIVRAGVTTPPQCSGSASAPTADSGYLCLYLTSLYVSVDHVRIIDTTATDASFTGASIDVRGGDAGTVTSYGDGKVSVYGASVELFYDGDGAVAGNAMHARGTWAATG